MKLFQLLVPFFLIITFFIGCSSTTGPKNKIRRKQMTRTERLRWQAIEHYRVLRLRTTKRGSRKAIKRPARPRSRSGNNNKIIRVVSNPTSTQRPQRDPEELEIELYQNIDYYCYKFEDKFENMDECRVYGLEKLIECREILLEKDNIDLVKCLKKRMKELSKQ